MTQHRQIQGGEFFRIKYQSQWEVIKKVVDERLKHAN